MWRSEKAEAVPEPDRDYLKVYLRVLPAVTITMDASQDDTYGIEDGFLFVERHDGVVIHFPVSDILQYIYSPKPF